MFDISKFIVSWIVFIALLIYAFLGLNSYISPKKHLKIYGHGTFLICGIFGLFAFITHDYYSYYGLIDKVQEWIVTPDVEIIYCYFIHIINYDYFIFRLVIVSIEFSILYYILKRYSIDFNITLCIFIIFELFSFSNTIRSSLSDTLFFVGTFAFIAKRTMLRFTLCLILTVGSCFFHKSGFMLFLPFILSFIKWRKWMIQILILSFPIVILIAKFLVELVFNKYFENSTYSNFQDFESGSVQLVSCMYVLIFSTLFLYTLWMLNKLLKSQGFSRYIYTFMLTSLYIWLVLLFLPTSRYLASRFLAHIMIPGVILLSYSFVKGDTKYRATLLILSLVMMVTTNFSILTKLREHLG